MKKINILICLLLLPVFSSNVLGGELRGTGWLYEGNDGDKKIVLLEKNGTFIYLNIYSTSGNTGEVFGDGQDTWKISNGLLVFSFNNGYRICSFENIHRKVMSGDCINKQGTVDKNIRLSLIE